LLLRIGLVVLVGVALNVVVFGSVFLLGAPFAEEEARSHRLAEMALACDNVGAIRSAASRLQEGPRAEATAAAARFADIAGRIVVACKQREQSYDEVASAKRDVCSAVEALGSAAHALAAEQDTRMKDTGAEMHVLALKLRGQCVNQRWHDPPTDTPAWARAPAAGAAAAASSAARP
jgi:hypothetical protein